MRRLMPLMAVIVAVQALSGCDEKRTAGGGNASTWTDTAASPARARSQGRTLVVDQPLSDAVGAAPEDLASQGSRLFDGAGRRPGGTTGVPAMTDNRGGTRTKRVLYTSGDGKSTTDLRTIAPPLPDTDATQYANGASAGSYKDGGQTLLGFAAFQIQQKYPSTAPIMSRLGWHAGPRRGSNSPQSPYRVTVHHTQGKRPMTEAETAAEVKAIQHYHMVGRAQEGKEAFDDIGYHFLIAGDGRVVEGRRAEYLGAHAQGANDGNIGISMMGDFNKLQPTDAQVSSLVRLVTYLSLKYKKDPMAKGFLEPHQHYNSTDCPGRNMMAILESLRRRIDKEHDEIAGGAAFTPLSVTDA